MSGFRYAIKRIYKNTLNRLKEGTESRGRDKHFPSQGVRGKTGLPVPGVSRKTGHTDVAIYQLKTHIYKEVSCH